jgi:hypothetical protein
MRRQAITTAVVGLAALLLPSVASAADRDRDGMRDSWEKRNGLNHKKNDARKDRDRDGLRNINEYRTDNNPRKADSDGDGVRDGDEGAGRVASFDAATGTLTIDLFGGGQLTGKVDGTTEIECESDDDDRPTTPPAPTKNGADDGPGDDSRGGRGDDDRSGSNSGRSGDDGDEDDDEERNCSSAELTVNRIVEEAELHDSDDGDPGVFDEIELG